MRPGGGPLRAVLGSRRLTVVLVLALGGAVAWLPRSVAMRLPGHNQGFAPRQPIAFSHRLHAGEIGITCLYCHFGAERSVHAGIPPVAVCLNCHRYVNPNDSPEIQKLYDAAGLGDDMNRDPAKPLQPVAWVRVHELPSFVRFDHSRHVLAGVNCRACHGAVERMDRVRQDATLAMGMCVNCHRRVNREGVNGRAVHASLDCEVCHH